MRRGEVDVGEFGIVDPAALAVGVVGSGQFFEVAAGMGPGVDGDSEHEHGQKQENDEAEDVGAGALFI